MNKIVTMLILACLMMTSWEGRAQDESPSLTSSEDEALTRKEIKRMRPHYIELGFGIDYPKFRDFATSPLIYKGRGLDLFFNALIMDKSMEKDFKFGLTLGQSTADYNNNPSSSFIGTGYFKYIRLYELTRWSNDKLNLKAGYFLSSKSVVRSNPGLGNSALGMDIFYNFGGSFKVAKDVSRHEKKEKKFLFINYTLYPQKRDLSFRIDLGLMNSNFRNGYSYLGQSQILNKNTFLDDYHFYAFSGFYMATQINYTLYKSNQNASRIFYRWEALQTGADYGVFEMSRNTIGLSVLINNPKEKK